MELLITAIDWLNPVVYLIGLAIAISAYQKSRKHGYIVVAIYFALAALTTFVGPTRISGMLAYEHYRSLDEQIQNEISLAYDRVTDEILQKHGRQNAGAFVKKVYFPFGPILLVTGLWLLAKREGSTKPATPPYSEPAARSPQG